MNASSAPALFAAALFAGILPVGAEVSLPGLFSSHMVLQRDAALHVWGTADPGEKITVQFDDHKIDATAEDDGSWLVGLPSQKADGKVHRMTVTGTNEIVLEDILIGDVWIGSGQSNMEWRLQNSEGGAEFVAAADHPQIRLLHVPRVQKPEPAAAVNATWNVCTPETVPAFSAVLYHFGRSLHEEAKVPIGLINSSWGGSPIEPWIVSEESSGKMYNGMIAPLIQFDVRGVIWYQGETNVIRKDGLAYREKMHALIEGWRTAFGQSDMPFYFVQIAPHSADRYGTGLLPAVWEAQTATLKLPHTGMAVITDLVDNLADIHPRKKEEVGTRLARWALAGEYGRDDVVPSGPLYKAMKVERGAVRIQFAHVAKGLKSRDGEALSEFQIAGADGVFVPAEASIDGGTVVVKAAAVGKPAHVHFGWHKSANPNLVNSAGLPASPFQTDDWQGATAE